LYKVLNKAFSVSANRQELQTQVDVFHLQFMLHHVYMTMTSFAITVYGHCCRRHVVGQRVVSDISDVAS